MRYLIGLGNYLAGDDGVGVHVVEYVVAHGLDRGFTAVDLATNALDMVAYLEPETEAVLAVDAAYLGLEPGEFRIFSPDEAETQKELAGFSTHEGDPLKVVELARAMGCTVPAFAFMGIEPGRVAHGTELSERVRERLPEYVAAAIGRLAAL
ncbi:MAG TPA: hydrogenase maturation protease [Thermoleophilia bacterium]|nr:hydrogenase maturation protease [Thermoleophilia bacterium]HQG54430.1 hydrogenase maturation protease [Thermoleophilia bacterium]HQJ98425.1 hydrogenase maturation protease [Thermoleophilia bacterium]